MLKNVNAQFSGVPFSVGMAMEGIAHNYDLGARKTRMYSDEVRDVPGGEPRGRKIVDYEKGRVISDPRNPRGATFFVDTFE